jgi:hypothetical protein
MHDPDLNRDHLALIAARFGIESVRSALDLGCGVGHWGRLVATVLPDEATITGIDREPAWYVRPASWPRDPVSATAVKGTTRSGICSRVISPRRASRTSRRSSRTRRRLWFPHTAPRGSRLCGAYTIKQAEEETWGWSREDARRFFTAGGEARMSSTSPGGDGRKRTGPRHVRWREAPSTPLAARSCTRSASGSRRGQGRPLAPARARSRPLAPDRAQQRGYPASQIAKPCV